MKKIFWFPKTPKSYPKEKLHCPECDTELVERNGIVRNPILSTYPYKSTKSWVCPKHNWGWSRENDSSISSSIIEEDSYDKLAQSDARSVENFVEIHYGDNKLEKFKKAIKKAGDNEYETGRIDGLIEAIKILRD